MVNYMTREWIKKVSMLSGVPEKETKLILNAIFDVSNLEKVSPPIYTKKDLDLDRYSNQVSKKISQMILESGMVF